MTNQNILKALVIETLIEIGVLSEPPKDYEFVTDLVSGDHKENLIQDEEIVIQ